MDPDFIAAHLEFDPPVKEADLRHDLWVPVPGWLLAFYLFWPSFIISEWLKNKCEFLEFLKSWKHLCSCLSSHLLRILEWG